MKRILIILPYIGQLPEYFPAFAHSLQYFSHKNDEVEINYYITTDDKRILGYSFPDFIKVQKADAGEIEKRFLDKCGVQVYYGYKLCDYKPLYGSAFDDIAEGYDYWGYCDYDTMLGDILSWLKEADFAQYERFGRYGHFTLYRNTPPLNELWKRKFPKTISIKEVARTTFPCYFDESGMNRICDKAGVKFLAENKVANVTPLQSFHFSLYNPTTHNDCPSQLFIWEKGKTFVLFRRPGEKDYTKREFAYIHYPYRKGLTVNETLGDAVIMTHKGFFNFEPERIDEYFSLYGGPDNKEQYEQFCSMQQAKWRQSRNKRFRTELKTLGFFKTTRNFLYRLKSLSMSILFYKS